MKEEERAINALELLARSQERLAVAGEQIALALSKLTIKKGTNK